MKVSEPQLLFSYKGQVSPM